jgi:prolipoprotein diacylglyceryl transferase
MYPDLSYLFHDLLGTARDNWLSIFKTFGFFLLLAFLVASWLLKRELKRREALGQLKPVRVTVVPGSGVTVWDYVFNGFFGFLLGYKIPYAVANLEAWQQNASGVLLSAEGWWWSGLVVAAAFVGYYVYLARKPVTGEAYERDVFPSERVGPITLMAALGGILGAKVFAILEYIDKFIADPLGVLLSGDGLAIYGGLLGGAFAVFLYLRKHGIKPVPVMDAVAPSLIIAYGVGRIGCQLSGDGDWGKAAGAQPGWWFLPDWVWAFDFPHNVLGRGVQIAGCELEYCTHLAEAVHPTSVYETAMAFTIGAVLWALRKRLTPLPGVLFCVYLFLNGVERFFIEFARINDRYNVMGFELSQAQIIAIGFMLAGMVGGLLFFRRARSLVQGEV